MFQFVYVFRQAPSFYSYSGEHFPWLYTSMGGWGADDNDWSFVFGWTVPLTLADPFGSSHTSVGVACHASTKSSCHHPDRPVFSLTALTTHRTTPSSASAKSEDKLTQREMRQSRFEPRWSSELPVTQLKGFFFYLSCDDAPSTAALSTLQGWLCLATNSQLLCSFKRSRTRGEEDGARKRLRWSLRLWG